MPSSTGVLYAAISALTRSSANSHVLSLAKEHPAQVYVGVTEPSSYTTIKVILI